MTDTNKAHESKNHENKNHENKEKGDKRTVDTPDQEPEKFTHNDDSSPAWKRFEQYVPDVVKRSIVSGIGAIVMGEDGQRAGLGDLKLPKEVVSHLVNQIEKSKRDLILVLARELRSFLDDVDISGVLQNALEGMTIDLHTQVRFLPTDKNGTRKMQMDPIETKVSTQKSKDQAAPSAKGMHKATAKSKTGTASKPSKASTSKAQKNSKAQKKKTADAKSKK